MKFFKDNINSNFYCSKIISNKLSAVYINQFCQIFYKNALIHNLKNAAHISFYSGNYFWLNHTYFGSKFNFTKSSWRKFTKLQAFL